MNVSMVNCLVLAICHFRLCRKWCFQKFYSIKKWMLEIFDKNLFKIMTLPNNLVLASRIWDHFLMFCSLQYDSWKLQRIEAWKTFSKFKTKQLRGSHFLRKVLSLSCCHFLLKACARYFLSNFYFFTKW